MKGNEEGKIISSSLNELVERFSRQNIVAEIEKRYQSAPSRLIPVSQIDDIPLISEVVIPDEVISYYAQTLREKGFYSSLVVRPKGNERYEIILGRKRFLGAKKAGMVSLPCTFAEVGEEEMLLMLLADTRDQREGNVMEMALVCDRLQKGFGYSQLTLAELSHQSRCQISNILRLLTLPKPIQKDICLKKLSYGQARALVGLKEEDALAFAKHIKEEKISVRKCEAEIRTLRKREKKTEPDYSYSIDGNILRIDFQSEEKLAEFITKNLK